MRTMLSFALALCAVPFLLHAQAPAAADDTAVEAAMTVEAIGNPQEVPVEIQEAEVGEIVLMEEKAEEARAAEKLNIPTPAGKTTPPGWFDDWNTAQAEAKRTGRHIMVLFTGSDWCYWCKVLRTEVLDTAEFKTFAGKNLVLVFMDSPRDVKLPATVRHTRKMLERTLQPGSGVPAIVLLSPDGKVLTRIEGFSPDLVKDLKKKIGAK